MEPFVMTQRLGEGEPLMFLHGWGMSSVVFDPLLEFLQQVRPVCIDLPGHGCGQPCHADAELWLEQLTTRLVGAASEPVDLCGWSLGGMLALALAATRPQLVRRLVLLGSTPKFSATNGWQHGLAAAQIRLLRRNLERDDRRAMGGFWNQMFAKDEIPASAHRRLIRRVGGPGRLPGREAAITGLDVLESLDLRPLVANIKVPTLVIHGSQDAIVPAAAGEWLATELPTARLKRLPGLGHAPHLTRPESVAALLREFLT